MSKTLNVIAGIVVWTVLLTLIALLASAVADIDVSLREAVGAAVLGDGLAILTATLVIRADA